MQGCDNTHIQILVDLNMVRFVLNNTALHNWCLVGCQGLESNRKVSIILLCSLLPRCGDPVVRVLDSIVQRLRCMAPVYCVKPVHIRELEVVEIIQGVSLLCPS